MIRRCENKAGHLSLLRNLVRELGTFKQDEKKEAAFQRGKGIRLNPNLSGWGASDGWAGYELTNDIEFSLKQPSSSRADGSQARVKARSWQYGPVPSWTCNNGPVKQNRQPHMTSIPKVTEKISPSKHTAPWMAVIKGKAVPLPAGAIARPVNYPIGYAPVKLPCPIQLQPRHQVPRGKKLNDALFKDALLELRVCAQGLVRQEDEDSILMPPPSSRPIRPRKPPQRYSSSSLERWPDVPISCICKNNTHTGFCASQWPSPRGMCNHLANAWAENASALSSAGNIGKT
uniref:SWIM-type domain-containing protein n=1 Tax=Globodera pallida TaxID=36090 RepID=A0A183BZN9_GLOPA